MIVGLGKAAEVANSRLTEITEHMQKVRDYFEKRLKVMFTIFKTVYSIPLPDNGLMRCLPYVSCILRMAVVINTVIEVLACFSTFMVLASLRKKSDSKKFLKRFSKEHHTRNFVLAQVEGHKGSFFSISSHYRKPAFC